MLLARYTRQGGCREAGNHPCGFFQVEDVVQQETVLRRVFQHCIEEINMKGESFVDAEWMAYLGAFHYLRNLNLADCKGINDSALWALTGMTSLKELDLSRCSKITDSGIRHLLSIPNLKKLYLSETGLTTDGVMCLSSLMNLTILDLGGLPVTDSALCSLQVLTQLEYLDLWGSKISNKGASVFKMFPKLSFLNLAWTNVSKLPDLPSVTCLNMSSCTIHSIFGGNETKAQLSELRISGATFTDVTKAFCYLDTSHLSFLDISAFPLNDFHFLTNMDGLEHLDLSFSRMDDNLIDSVASIGMNLRYLNLSNTRVGSDGIAVLAGKVPNLETLSLSHTAVDDDVLSYISIIPSLREIDLRHTNIKGFAKWGGNKPDKNFSLTALQNLDHLESLNLEDAYVKDEGLHPLSGLRGLSHLYLKSDFLTDISLYAMSSIPRLEFLGIRGAVLTNTGLGSFDPSSTLQTLDLRGCWLLTSDGILAFCKKHPQIEVRHELNKISADRNVRYGSSYCSMGASGSKPKRGKSSSVTSKILKKFIDERIKYSREELLVLQFSPFRSLSSRYTDGTTRDSSEGVTRSSAC